MSEIASNGTKKRKLAADSPGRNATSVSQVSQYDDNAPPGMEFVLAELSRLREQVMKLENQASVKSEANAHDSKNGRRAIADLTGEDTSPLVKSEHGSSERYDRDDLYNATPVPEVVNDGRRGQNTTNVEEHLASRSSPRTPALLAMDFQEDPRPNVTDISICLYNGMRMPTMVRRFPVIQDLQLPLQPNTKFHYDFLRNIFGGNPVADNWYLSNGSRGIFNNVGPYALLSREFDPLLPRLPGAHGAHITPYLAEIGIGQTFPLFIRDIGASHLRYYGTYEAMPSDCLGHNEMLELPEQVKRHWAQKLGTGSANGSKAALVVHALKERWPAVRVGWWDAKNDSYMNKYDWESTGNKAVTRAITEEEAQHITEGAIMTAFERQDLDNPPGVSLCYEYLKCVGYDSEMYQALVTKMNEH
ncbi:0a530fd7-b025-415d-bd27-5b264e3763da [Sclerotinia trifoliorum]|uniref:0a530fd7-b025-415d-bd27-5b264e3763da n=1 Tax=Sclerotinia trifoliorum TaxID=28548 RepID=A0A8H2VXE6_9HELO|nr:0a530fd7-b025-415d-bd27-5b264e3763da [Sclerotinia trifoliorum]